MDHFFHHEMQMEMQMEMLWHEIPEIQTLLPRVAPDPAVIQSAFVQYTRPGTGFSLENLNFPLNHRNSNRRMIEILRAMRAMPVENREPESSQCYRHMINERHRREKMRQNYTDLHLMLPPRTKNDKNSIVHTAASQLLNLQALKEELLKRNKELQASLEMKTKNSSEVATIELRVADPSSGIGSMIEIMKCLKSMELKVRAIRSKSFGQEFEVTVEIEKEGAENALVEMLRESSSLISWKQPTMQQLGI
ncbi:transcription factor bHLH92 [Magnolia sinica]|uniref:transcription factor bHLH92 n=1 Tax=Magnolia sinica TaxID=86752 RepID=UPI002658F989|nr:transcription factor bHLH92 [Magnolia sinica]XP_058105494.1 transcription factor bHLH92 [Magnolia sinica]